MRYAALATDYDGTLARDGFVEEETVAALERLKGSGRRLVLVTGRQVDVADAFSRIDLCDRVVAENGAVLYRPETGALRLLSPPADTELVRRLRRRGAPLWVGRVVVATDETHLQAAIETIRELGAAWDAILNKGAVMLLPAGVDKASGLRAALADLGLQASAAVGVGDAENDGAFLRSCGYAVAVANALPALKEAADWVTAGDDGAGVRELISRLVEGDLAG